MLTRWLMPMVFWVNWTKPAGVINAPRSKRKKALWFAQRAGDPASVYLWQWQLGRLYRAQGQMAAAIAAYRQGSGDLKPDSRQLDQ